MVPIRTGARHGWSVPPPGPVAGNGSDGDDEPGGEDEPDDGEPDGDRLDPPVVPLAVAPPLPGADVPGGDPRLESPDPGDDGPVDGELVDGEPETAGPVPRVDGVVVVPAESDAPLPGAVLCPGRPLPVVDALPGESVLPGPARR